MWFWLSIGALIFWSGSDLFGKIGCRESSDKLSHLKMTAAVGMVMGAHALYEIVIGGVELDSAVFLTYLPVSLLYIVSMVLSYAAFRYIELSISSPICNSSGAIVAILTFAVRGISADLPAAAFVAVALVCIGTVYLGFVEANEDEELREKRQELSNHKYAKSALAFILPIGYCLLDALGTFADSIVLERLNEDSANCAYELTFFACGLICLIYVYIIKKNRFSAKSAVPKLTGAVFETIGQLCYIYALSDTEHVAFSAPIIASFCIASVIWSRIFLKERLSRKHYAAIGIVVLGIVLMGILEI